MHAGCRDVLNTAGRYVTNPTCPNYSAAAPRVNACHKVARRASSPSSRALSGREADLRLPTPWHVARRSR